MADFQSEVDRLTTDVANLTTVESGAITLLNSLTAQIRANANDPVALDTLATQIETQTAALAAAVAANTPADPATVAPAPTPPTDTGGITGSADGSGLDPGTTSVG